jgi:hypothetical protein
VTSNNRPLARIKVLSITGEQARIEIELISGECSFVTITPGDELVIKGQAISEEEIVEGALTATKLYQRLKGNEDGR